MSMVRWVQRWRKVSTCPTDPMQVRFGMKYPMRWGSYLVLQHDCAGTWCDVETVETPCPTEDANPSPEIHPDVTAMVEKLQKEGLR